MALIDSYLTSLTFAPPKSSHTSIELDRKDLLQDEGRLIQRLSHLIDLCQGLGLRTKSAFDIYAPQKIDSRVLVSKSAAL